LVDDRSTGDLIYLINDTPNNAGLSWSELRNTA
jgi:hypothetical protein